MGQPSASWGHLRASGEECLWTVLGRYEGISQLSSGGRGPSWGSLGTADSARKEKVEGWRFSHGVALRGGPPLENCGDPTGQLTGILNTPQRAVGVMVDSGADRLRGLRSGWTR